MIQCVPSWAESQRAFQRLRWGCLARAVENQSFVVHASLVGELGFEPVRSTYGNSAIISPSVDPFPVEAILRETEMNEEGVALADLDVALLTEVRASSPVANWQDRFRSHWRISESAPIKYGHKAPQEPG